MPSRFSRNLWRASKIASGALLSLIILTSCKSAEDWVRFDRATAPRIVDDGLAPIAIITNAPADDSTDASLAAVVGGSGVESYLYKIGPAASLDCSDATGYSTTRATAQVVNDAIDDYMGAMAICVLGQDSAGRRQSLSEATRYAWTRTWFPKIFVESPGREATKDTNVTVHLHAPAEYTQVYITDDATCAVGGSWQARTDTKIFALPGGSLGATATIYARFRTAGGKLSPCVSRDVFFSTVATATSCSGAGPSSAISGELVDSGGVGGNYSDGESCTFTVTSAYPVTFTFAAFDVEQDYDFMYVYSGTAIPANLVGTFTGNTIPTPYTASGTTVFEFDSDSSVNQSGYRITWDAAASDLSNSVVINNGDVSTMSTAVTLTILNNIGLKEMYVTNDVTCAAGGTWEKYAYTKPWTLTAGNGTKTVAIKFRDWVGHETPCESDSIMMYIGAPTATLAGTPANLSGDDNLAVTVAGTDVAKYKYKVGPAASTDCSAAAGYSAPTLVSAAITDSLASYSSVAMRLCVVGLNPIGTQQAYASATVYNWTRQVPLFLEVSDSGRWVTEGNQNLTFTISSAGGGTSTVPITIDYDLYGELVTELGLLAGQVVLPAGQSSVNVVIPITQNVAADVDKTLSLGISKVSGSHRIGYQSLSMMTVRDAQRASTQTVVDIGIRTRCAVLGSGELRCMGSVGGPTAGTTVFNTGYQTLAGGTLFKKMVVEVPGSHFCALAMSDELYCWGWGFDGQLGQGDRVDRPNPTLIAGLTWKQVTGSPKWSVVCGIDSNDDLYCWGDQTYSEGQAGNGTANDSLSPTKIDAVHKYRSIVMSEYHACAITTTDALYCWGSNFMGQVGDGSTTSRYAPVLIDSGVGYATVAVVDYRTCGITTAGDVKCWGWDHIASNASTPQLIDNARDYTTLAMAGSKTCALSAGELYCYGRDDNNDFGFGTSITTMMPFDPGTTYAEIVGAVQTDFVCGRRTADNRVKCFGSLADSGNDWYRSDYPKTPVLWDGDVFTSIKQVLNGVCGFTTSGYAKCLGNGLYLMNWGTDAVISEARTAAVPVGTTVRFKQLSDRCGLDTSGYLRCWGMNQSLTNVRGNESRTAPVTEFSNLQFKTTSIGYHGGCGIRTDDTLWCWSAYAGDGSTDKPTNPVAVDAPTTYSKVSVGTDNTCAITTAGALKCWGENTNGSSGVGDTNPHLTPMTVGALSYNEISISEKFVCAITTVGELYCWGKNTAAGGIGDGGSVQSTSPVRIGGVVTFSKVAVTAGGSACAIRTSDSRVLCWGYGTTIGNGSTATQTTPTLTSDTAAYTELYGALISSTGGGGTVCGKAVNGGSFDLKCWGDFRFPRLLVPTTLYSGTIKSVAMSYRDSLVLVSDIGDLFYLGTARNVPGVAQRLKKFEFILGLVDR